ncbi:peptidase inhibitor family I36 protein [Nonomuraea terrae]|uniref:peptidase inhibitor family I36 protein n=1 Tax=Nonomuraea terrae TaxID=2530383 RepID=UPI0037963696
MRSLRTAALAAGSVAAAAALALSVAPVQAASLPAGVQVVHNATTVDCPDGYFCSYTERNQSGKMYKTEGNWEGRLTGIRSVFNNGRPFQDADHVDLTWESSTATDTWCFHYWNGSGTDAPWKANFSSPVTVTEVEWRGEC